MKHRSLPFVWVLVAIALTTSARARRVGSQGDLAADLERIRGERGVPALAGVLLRGGRVIGDVVAGTVEAGSSTPATIEDAWHIGSDTKAMTATLAARLVEQGKIGWDTTVADALPDIAGEMQAAYKSVTLKQLLGHRGGMVGDGPVAGELQGALWEIERKLAARPMTERRRAAAKRILAAPPAGTAGKTYAYSNFGYIVAGAMLERAGGDSWENLMRRELFEPLGMNSAGFGPPPRIHGHSKKDDRWLPKVADNPAVLGPAGTVHVTLADWAKFAAVHLGHGPAGYLTPESLRVLHEPLPPADANDTTRYALGWIVFDRDGRTMLAHDGSNTMWYASIFLDPARDEARLAACNAAEAQACHDVIAALSER